MPSKEWADANREKCRQSGRRHYSAHTQAVKEKIWHRRREIHQWFKAYKRTLRCEQCGEQRSPCLDFHHTNPVHKEIDLGRAWRKGWSKDRILAEAAKCMILCANCHRCVHHDPDS